MGDFIAIDMKGVIVCLFAFIVLAVAQFPVGTYRQCDFNTGDEIILDVAADSDHSTTMTFLFGGCLGGVVQYEVVATYDWEFESSREDGGNNVAYHYHSAVATPYTEEAVEALQNTCNTRFSIGVEQHVLNCLFCPTRYDIFMNLEEGVFVLGDGIACDEADRPTQYEESKFVLTPYYESSSNIPLPSYSFFYGTYSYSTVPYTFSFPYNDDDGAIFDDDDDFQYTLTGFTTLTYSVEPNVSDSSDVVSLCASIALVIACLTIFI